MRNLRRAQPAQQPQRQRQLGCRGQRRMAAGENQAKLVVPHRSRLLWLVRFRQQRRLGLPRRPCCLAAEPVDRAIAGRGDDPARRTGRQALDRPAFQGRGEGVLDRVLGGVNVAKNADQDGHRTAVFFAENPFDVFAAKKAVHRGSQPSAPPADSGASVANGRTSMGSVVAVASRRPHSSAASRSGALMMLRPPRCSLPSV